MIGNNDYRDPQVPKLRNAVNDAQIVRAGLERAGFHVIFRQNASLAEMAAAVREFVGAIGPGTVAFSYYSGHGMEIQNENFLIPVEFHVSDETHAKTEAYKVLDL